MLQSSAKTILLFFPGPLGGAEMIVALGYKKLIELNANVELWIVGETRAPEAMEQFSQLTEGLPVRKFLCRSIIDFRLIQELKGQLQNDNIVAIHAHGFKAAVYAKLAERKQKLIVTHHGKTAHTFKVRFYEFIEDLIMKRADQVIAVSRPMQENLQKQGISSKLIENFLTISHAPAKDLPASPLKLIFIGRLSPEKGCSFLIEAMRNFDKKDFLLTVVGDGIQREELELKASKENTVFLGFRKDVSELLSQHHVLIMPSLREGLPLTLIEATCNQLPVIASHVGGIPNLVNDKKNGILIKPESTEELVRAIIEVRNNFPSFKHEAQKLAPIYRERFSDTTWAQKTIEIYKLFNQ